MPVVRNLDPKKLRRLSNIIVDTILSTLTIIRTLYVDDSEGFSGTGLLVSRGSRKYVLTADHVLTPRRRVPPQTIATKKHYHTATLRRESTPMKAFALRHKFYRSESLDLALAESTLSQRHEFQNREDYYPLELLENTRGFDVWKHDLFVVCGFPQAQMTAIPVVQEVRHGMLIHYFSGAHGSDDPDSGHRFRFKYDGDSPEPAGLSGSPVWLLRDGNDSNQPLNLDYLFREPGKNPKISAVFSGIVCEYFPKSSEISTIKPELCSAFVRKAMKVLPTLRMREEDDWICEQLAKFPRR